MYRDYISSQGNIIRTWYNTLGFIDILSRIGGKLIEIDHIPFDINSNDPIFIYNNEIFHVNNFIYLPLSALISLINEGINKDDQFYVDKYLGLATFMKEYKHLGITMEYNSHTSIIPEFGSGLKQLGEDIPVLMVPIEHRYNINSWYKQIEFQAYDKKLREIVGIEELYFIDCWDAIATGKFKLIDISNLSHENTISEISEISVLSPININHFMECITGSVYKPHTMMENIVYRA